MKIQALANEKYIEWRSYMKRLNRSFSQGYVNEDWIDANKIYEQTVKK